MIEVRLDRQGDSEERSHFPWDWSATADLRRPLPGAPLNVSDIQAGVNAATTFIEEQIEAGALDGGVARCRATTRKGKPCQRTPLPERDYCPSHQHLEAKAAA